MNIIVDTEGKSIEGDVFIHHKGATILIEGRLEVDGNIRLVADRIILNKAVRGNHIDFKYRNLKSHHHLIYSNSGSLNFESFYPDRAYPLKKKKIVLSENIKPYVTIVKETFPGCF